MRIGSIAQRLNCLEVLAALGKLIDRFKLQRETSLWGRAEYSGTISMAQEMGTIPSWPNLSIPASGHRELRVAALRLL
jgi:hypothetical protein